MNKIDSLNQVAEFHKTFQAPILEKPQIPSEDRCNLRVELLREELGELKQAIEDKNIVEIADALCDLQYVLSGAVLEFGLGDKFVKLFNEVQRSNMSKACDTMQDAISTLSHYKQKDGTEGYYKEVNGKWIVYRNGDNKVLKSVKYSPANLENIITKMNVAICSDHAGYELKESIKNNFKSINFIDFGTNSTKSMDYPDVAHLLAKSVESGEVDWGIAICGSGNGINMTSNKYKDVRSALCWNKEIASLSKQHNNANVISLPARFISNEESFEIINSYIDSEFEGGRHQNRIDKISNGL